MYWIFRDDHYLITLPYCFRSVGAKLCARLSNTITAREGEETFKSTLIRRLA